jgi:hypothetical protein
MTSLTVIINGRAYGPRDVRDDLSMNDFLREYLGMTGTKFGCGAAQCLSCAVIIDNPDGTSETSPTCIVPAVRVELRPSLFVATMALSASALTAYAVSDARSDGLASVESFSSIGDPAARSAAFFTELGKVLTSPRCLNCHPAGDRPRQGDTARLHQPPVERGPDGFGLSALRCPVCHRAANFEPGRVPGSPTWRLAPREMGWEGKTLGEICAQIKDPARNGGRSLEAITEHVGEDRLVGWAWAPGSGRKPAPGTQKEAGALVDAWVKTGAKP